MKIIQSPLFARKVKKLHQNKKSILDDEIRKIISNPKPGEGKKGDLKDIFVHKFKIKDIQYLLSYWVKSDVLELIAIGPHENYYRDLKSYLRSK